MQSITPQVEPAISIHQELNNFLALTANPPTSKIFMEGSWKQAESFPEDYYSEDSFEEEDEVEEDIIEGGVPTLNLGGLNTSSLPPLPAGLQPIGMAPVSNPFFGGSSPFDLNQINQLFQPFIDQKTALDMHNGSAEEAPLQ